jgi:hypothetical protein
VDSNFTYEDKEETKLEPLNDNKETKPERDEMKLSSFSNKQDPNKMNAFSSFSSFARLDGGKTESKKVSAVIKSDNKMTGELVDFLNTSRYFNDEDIKNSPVLLLEEISGNILRGQKLQINASGLVGGMRNAKDGIAFFGKQLKKV